MASQLGSLGLQSNVLTNELLEKLKAADESAKIKPYETKIETNTAKQKALTELTTKLSSFQTAVSSLGDATAFQKRKVTPSVTGDSAAATLTASNGVSVQNLSVKVDKIAQKDVYQSKGLVKDTDRVLTNNQSAGKFTITQNGKEYVISVDANTTYSDLAERINSATDGNVVAKIVSTGESGTPYRLTLSSKETGADNAIGFRADSDGEAILSNFGWNLKKTSIAEADLKGYSFSGGSKVSTVTNLSNTLANDVKFTVFAGSEKFEIEVNQGQSYQDLISKINTATNGKVKMTAVQTSGNGYTFNLVAGDNATSSTKITLYDGVSTTDASGNKSFSPDASTTNFLTSTLNFDIKQSYTLNDANGEYHLKKAQNAEFTLDGVKMYRSTNSITDVGVGITLNLLKAGEINFDIKQDTEGLSSTMDELVEAYNELINYLTEVTSYNSETKTSGDLADVSEVKRLRSNITSMLFDSQTVEGKSTDSNGNETKTNVFLSMIDYGLSLNDSGLLKFDSTKFNEKIAEDVELAEKFFAGTTGFEELNVTAKAQTLKDDIDFTNKEFKITFGDTTYDLSKTTEGNIFKLESTLTQNQGESNDDFEARKAKDRAQKLLDHINSFNISGLKITMQELKVTENGVQKTGYALKFKSDDGSDFEISGDSDILGKLGLEAKKVSPQVKEGTGIFSALKTTLQGYTRVSTKDSLKGSLTLYSERLSALNENLKTEKQNSQTKIDNYYETMYNKWVEYEKIIGNIKTQSDAISQMIQASQNSKNNS